MKVQSVMIIGRAELRKRVYVLEGRCIELGKEREACNDPGAKTGKNIKICELQAVADFIQKELLQEEKINPEDYGLPCDLQIG